MAARNVTSTYNINSTGIWGTLNATSAVTTTSTYLDQDFTGQPL